MTHNRRTIAILAMLAFVVAFAPVVSAQTPRLFAPIILDGGAVVALPVGANLQQYPLVERQLSAAQQAQYGLRPSILYKSWTGFQWHRQLKRFVLETLPPLTLVLVDESGDPIYREACGNRLVTLIHQECPACPGPAPAPVDPHLEEPTPRPSPTPAPPRVEVTPPAPREPTGFAGWMYRRGTALEDVFRAIGQALGWLIG